MRRFVVLLAALAIVAGGAGSAQAAVEDINVYGGFILHDPEFKRVTLFGSIVCTPGEGFSIRVSIWSEGGDKASGRTAGVCGEGEVTGQTEEGATPWVARLRVVDGSFTDEEILWRARAQTATGNRTESGFSGLCFFCA
ncbi:MAG: hypothetical protein HY658_11540 [Actinobacteria bacterium]|nr:hypothetical protein [Actinomycetota bacterium]